MPLGACAVAMACAPMPIPPYMIDREKAATFVAARALPQRHDGNRRLSARRGARDEMVSRRVAAGFVVWIVSLGDWCASERSLAEGRGCCLSLIYAICRSIVSVLVC